MQKKSENSRTNKNYGLFTKEEARKMLKNLRKAVLAAMFVGMGVSSAWGAESEYDISTGGNAAPVAVTGGNTNYYYMLNNETQHADAWDTDPSNLTITGDTNNATAKMVFGTSIGNAQLTTKSDVTVNSLTLSTLGGTNRRAQLDINTTKSNERTTLNIANALTLATGINNGDSTIYIQGSSNTSTHQNALIADSFVTTANNPLATMNVGGNSLFQVAQGATVYNTTFNLGESNPLDTRKGILNIDMTLASGQILGNGLITGDVVLNNATPANSLICVASGKEQIYEGSVTNTSGKIWVDGSTANSHMKVENGLNVDGGLTQVKAVAGAATLDVTGTLVVTQKALFNGTTGFGINGNTSGKKGTVNADWLTMSAIPDAPGDAKARVDVGEYGELNVVGTNNDNMNILHHATVNVADNGTASFADKVTLQQYSDITALGTGSKLVFGDIWHAEDNNSMIQLGNGATGDFSAITDFDITSGTLHILKETNNDAATTVKVQNGVTLSQDGMLFSDEGTNVTLIDTLHPDRKADINIDKLNGVKLGGIVNANSIVIDTNNEASGIGNIYSIADGFVNGGTFNLDNDFTVMKGSDVADRAGVTTHVRGQGYIFGLYDISGHHIFEDGLTIGSGSAQFDDGLSSVNGATVTIGTDINKAFVKVNSSSITVGDGKTLYFENEHTATATPFTFAGTGNRVTGGTVDLRTKNEAPNTPVTKGFDTIVDNGAEVTFNNSTWMTAGYEQNSGNVILDGATDLLDTYTFKQSGGKLISNDRRNSVLVQKDVATIYNHGFFSSVANFVKGANFSDGSTYKATNAANLISGTGNLNFTGGSKIDLSSASMRTDGFDKVYVDDTSSILIGLDSSGGKTTMLDVQKGSAPGVLESNLKKTLQFDSSLMKAMYQDTTKTKFNHSKLVSADVLGWDSDAWTNQSIYGDYQFQYDDGIKLTTLEKYDPVNLNDVDAVQEQLNDMYDTSIFSTGLSGALANYGLDDLTFLPTDSGQLNSAIFDAINEKKEVFSFTDSNGKVISGLLDQGVVQSLLGANIANPVYISRDVTRNLTNTLFSRTDAYRKALECVTANCGTALGSTILNDRYMNRVWVGGIGDWENASSRNDYSGYKYKAAGIQLGYDRAFGAMIAGVSAAYIRGNYEDKAATAHDSKIDNWAFDAYATYNFSSGFFATVMGGYTYSKNKINEYYGAGTDSVGKVYKGLSGMEDYHTNTWWASAKIGYDIEVCDNFTISPSIGANWWDSRASAHNLNFAGKDITNYSGIRTHGVELPLEVRVAYDINFSDQAALTLEANGGYAYNFTDKGVRGTVTNIDGTVDSLPSSYALTGRKLGHNSWYGGAGVKFRYDHWDMGVKYDYYGRSSYNDHRVTAQVGYSF